MGKPYLLTYCSRDAGQLTPNKPSKPITYIWHCWLSPGIYGRLHFSLFLECEIALERHKNGRSSISKRIFLVLVQVKAEYCIEDGTLALDLSRIQGLSCTVQFVRWKKEASCQHYIGKNLTLLMKNQIPLPDMTWSVKDKQIFTAPISPLTDDIRRTI